MPKNPINYDNTFFYRIICKDIAITDCYVGHTTNIIRRRSQHKHSCNTATNENYNSKKYQYIRENGGWDAWELIEIERMAVKDAEEAKKRERYWLDFYKATLNCNIPSRTQCEYYNDNKNNINEKNKQYQINNKNEIKEYKKQYRIENKEKIMEKDRLYYIENKDKIKEQSKFYAIENKDKVKEYHKQYYINKKQESNI